LELIEPKALLFAHGCCGALYKYLNTIQKTLSDIDAWKPFDEFAFQILTEWGSRTKDGLHAIQAESVDFWTLSQSRRHWGKQVQEFQLQ